LWKFRDSHLGVSGQNDIWVLVSWLGKKYIIRGKVAASLKFGSWWVLWIRVCSWFVRAPKCSNNTLTNLLFGLCRSMWVIELLVNLPSPISKLQHTPLPPKCYKPGSTPQFRLLPLFTFGLTIDSIKELGGVSISFCNSCIFYSDSNHYFVILKDTHLLVTLIFEICNLSTCAC
jgi:hypothetical protein